MASKNQQNPPALRTISDFKNKLQGGGARPNLFEVVLAFPGDLSISNNVVNEARFMVKAAALPASNIAPIDVAFRGRLLKVAGDRTFDTWTITVLNDTDFGIRGAFERWMNSINRVTDATGAVNPSDYQADAFVYQLDRDGSVLRKYKFHDVFPTNISQIDLSYDSSDTLEEFTVELQVLFWTAAADNAGGGAGDIN
jgi:hypothetical protein|tara:strand:+ start:5305 stop:5895 length:591 start_codon:yes stop_codon:yes gene_type:complete